VLLAKSLPKDKSSPKTLITHTEDVIQAADAIFGGRFGDRWCDFFRIDDSKAFRLNLRISALTHDAGKADNGNQAMLRGQPEARVVRHEHLSALLLLDRRVQAGIAERGADPAVVTGAVLSHHLKARPDTFMVPVGEGRICKFLTDDPDFPRLWGMTGLPFPELPSVLDLRSEPDEVYQAKRKLSEIDRQVSRSKDAVRCRMLTAVRAALIAADALGSAEVRLGGGITEWAKGVLGEPLRGEDIRQWVMEGRRLAMGVRWRGLDPFQEEITHVGSRGLLIAPCGSGKTLAAWNWIANQLEQTPKRWVLFLYPTRATANEGFRDYGANAPPALAALLHGTSRYELQNMFDTPEAGEAYQTQARLYSLGLWQKRIVTATVDQFLAYTQYAYGPMCLLPMLADSVVVIDEVHTFDPSMMANLKRFLSEHDVPVLAMTATLGEDRRMSLVGTGLNLYAKSEDEQSRVDRYSIQRATHAIVVQEALSWSGPSSEKKVLLVSNQVKVCQRLHDTFQGRCLTYHARFRLMDRQDRHTALVEALKRETKSGRLGLATQVAEQSLDIDADLLGTELATVHALVQRFGRTAREYPLPPGRIGRILVSEPDDIKPYSESDVSAAQKFLAYLDGSTVSQADLEEAMLRFAPPVEELDRTQGFYDSGPWASGKDEMFRDIESFTLTCILDQDVDEVLSLLRSGLPWDGYSLPVLKSDVDRLGWEDERLPRWLRVVPTSHYDDQAGFRSFL
jgi:CRISPR-associated endonuclease/helicase Cas3